MLQGVVRGTMQGGKKTLGGTLSLYSLEFSSKVLLG